MVEDGAFSHKIGFVIILWEILNLKGNPNHITDSIGLILPVGGASAVAGLRSTGLPRLVSV